MECVMPDDLFTERQKLEQRRDILKRRRQRAAAMEAKIDRTLATNSYKIESQRKMCLGAALLRAVEANSGPLDTLRKFILPHITRETDRAALVGTPFEFSEDA
jgi:hypothetical protein